MLASELITKLQQHVKNGQDLPFLVNHEGVLFDLYGTTNACNEENGFIISGIPTVLYVKTVT